MPHAECPGHRTTDSTLLAFAVQETPPNRRWQPDVQSHWLIYYQAYSPRLTFDPSSAFSGSPERCCHRPIAAVRALSRVVPVELPWPTRQVVVAPGADKRSRQYVSKQACAFVRRREGTMRGTATAIWEVARAEPPCHHTEFLPRIVVRWRVLPQYRAGAAWVQCDAGKSLSGCGLSTRPTEETLVASVSEDTPVCTEPPETPPAR